MMIGFVTVAVAEDLRPTVTEVGGNALAEGLFGSFLSFFEKKAEMCFSLHRYHSRLN